MICFRFVINVGDVDRGADIDCLSLFPGEKEVLSVPALAVLFVSIEMLLLHSKYIWQCHSTA